MCLPKMTAAGTQAPSNSRGIGYKVSHIKAQSTRIVQLGDRLMWRQTYEMKQMLFNNQAPA